MKTKTAGTQTHSDFKPGDLVVLKYAQGCQCKVGWKGIVVPFRHFPEYYEAMLDTIDEKDLEEHFIAVEWLPISYIPEVYSDPANCNQEKYNGFYSKARFEKVENVAKS